MAQIIKPEVDIENSWAKYLKPTFTNETVEKENPKWWGNFNDDALNSLVGLSYRQNLSLRASGLRVYEARTLLGVAFGQYYPQNSLSASGAETIRQSEHTTPFPSFNESVASYNKRCQV